MYYPMRMVRTRTHKYILNLAHGLEYPFASDLWGSDMWQGVLKRGDKMMGQRDGEGVPAPAEGGTVRPADRPERAEEPRRRSPDEADRDGASRATAGWQKATNDPWLIKEMHE